MSELVRDETPMEFFREQLERAMEHQKVSTSAFTEYYLVNLLSRLRARRAAPSPSPASTRRRSPLLYVARPRRPRAASARASCATMGDTALFVSGFFADSLSRGLVDLGYYQAMGGPGLRAPQPRGLGRAASGSTVFSELSGRFSEFADVLAEVSETSHLSTQPLRAAPLRAVAADGQPARGRAAGRARHRARAAGGEGRLQ